MYIADLHIHSRYSRATSRECVPEHLDLWAGRKGIQLLGTGDFTYPAWRQELKEKLAPAEEGLYTLKEEFRLRDNPAAAAENLPRFVISGEISSIYKKNGKTRKVHNLILLPGLAEAEALSRRLEAIGNIHSDGRPILGLDSRDLLEITLETCPEAIFIPAHIWTPHFSLFGAFSGFDTIEECFEDLTGEIHALETGLSSDPPMNWRLSALDGYNLVSNSDAHSPAKLGREANLLDTELSYKGLRQAIQTGKGLAGTIEFFPEEGKYHLDGHRKCGLCLAPAQTKDYGGKCPVCGRKLTIGVLHRVEELADRPEGYEKDGAPRFESLAPLLEVIAASTGKSAASVKVQRQYEAMLKELGTEFSILREIPEEAIKSCAGPCVAEGIRRLREGKVERVAGFDGEYGKVKIIDPREIEELCGQVSLFESVALPRAAAPKKKKALKKAAPLAAQARDGKETSENLRQQEAIASQDRVIAVIAGPGTGKTYTLTRRIAFLIQRQHVKPEDITAVTFTNKAAGELRERLSHLLGKADAERVRVGTFHSICLKLLESWQGPVALADDAVKHQLAKTALKASDCRMTTAKFLRRISLMKTGLAEPAETAGFSAAAENYQDEIKGRGLKDFDDLLLDALSRVEQDPSKNPFDENQILLVDEFQDIDPIQYRLIIQWSSRGRGLFVIGDPDQSIYGFRGSDPEGFLRLRKDFPKTRVIRLEKNYRSTPEILSCALPVINQNPGALRTLEPVCGKGEKVRLITAESDLSEAIFIAGEINRMTGGMDMMDAQRHGVKRDEYREFGDIAILYRTHHQAELLERCLRKESIPYTVTGKQDFLQDDLVRGTLSFFQAMLRGKTCPPEAAELLFKTNPLETAAYLSDQLQDTLWSAKPAELLQSWREKTGLTASRSLKRLGEMALFYDDMKAFSENLLLGEEQDLKRSASGKLYNAGTVSLMTIHASKGLEFPVVFLCGLNQDCLPMKDADEEEERRLFFVGMTRAREELILLSGQRPSPFLAELPDSVKRQEAYKKKEQRKFQQMSFLDF
ncbi:UvrD-helicase domain-containing protein [bacterium 210820-DFI.6.37]|nr:UvrD-helicase domain-containing protein [bacterium 210820-DFI.6.37]